jgi:hypothetical protein
MPVPKRYFHLSQDINSDPEIWSFTSEFTDRALRTWLQILVFLDKTGNCWRTSGDWLATLSRTVRQTAANVSRQIEWMIAKGWLRVREAAADGSPVVLEAPNWSKYNRRQGQKGDASNPNAGAHCDPLLSFPTPNLSLPITKKEVAGSPSSKPANDCSKHRSRKLADNAFIEQLKNNPAYADIDIDREIGKIRAWQLTPKGRGKELTRGRLVNWLNRIDPPISGYRPPLTCTKRIPREGSERLYPCGLPATLDSSPNEPRCFEHLPRVERREAVAC